MSCSTIEDPRKLRKESQRLNQKYLNLHYAGCRHSDRSGKRQISPYVTDKRDFGMADPSKEPEKVSFTRPLAITELGRNDSTQRPACKKLFPEASTAVRKPLRQKPSCIEMIAFGHSRPRETHKPENVRSQSRTSIDRRLANDWRPPAGRATLMNDQIEIGCGRTGGKALGKFSIVNTIPSLVIR